MCHAKWCYLVILQFEQAYSNSSPGSLSTPSSSSAPTTEAELKQCSLRVCHQTMFAPSSSSKLPDAVTPGAHQPSSSSSSSVSVAPNAAALPPLHKSGVLARDHLATNSKSRAKGMRRRHDEVAPAPERNLLEQQQPRDRVLDESTVRRDLSQTKSRTPEVRLLW